MKLEAKKRMLSQTTTKAASRLVRTRPGLLAGEGWRSVSIKRVSTGWKSSLGSTHAHRVVNFPTTISGRKLRSNVILLCFDVSNIIRWHSLVLAFYANVLIEYELRFFFIILDFDPIMLDSPRRRITLLLILFV